MKYLILFIMLLFVSMPALAQKKMSETGYGTQNFIINGNMTFWQRGTSVAANTGGTSTYLADRFFTGIALSTGTATDSQSSDVPTDSQSGSHTDYSLAVTVGTAQTPAASEFAYVGHTIEGYNYAQISGRQATLSFWVKSSVTGPYHVFFRNSAYSYSYVVEYLINQANTWEKKAITIAFNSPGTWVFNEGAGLRIGWTLAAGSTYNTTEGSWISGDYRSNSNQVNLFATGGNVFKLTKVMLNVGDRAAPFALAGGDVQGELAKCQRYYTKSTDPSEAVAVSSRWLPGSSYDYGYFSFPVVMRATPVIYTCNDANCPTGTTGAGAYSYTVNTVGNYTNGSVTARANGFGISMPNGSAAQYARFGFTADAEL